MFVVKIKIIFTLLKSSNQKTYMKKAKEGNSSWKRHGAQNSNVYMASLVYSK
jgi:hypothetical protein